MPRCHFASDVLSQMWILTSSRDQTGSLCLSWPAGILVPSTRTGPILSRCSLGCYDSILRLLVSVKIFYIFEYMYCCSGADWSLNLTDLVIQIWNIFLFVSSWTPIRNINTHPPPSPRFDRPMSRPVVCARTTCWPMRTLLVFHWMKDFLPFTSQPIRMQSWDHQLAQLRIVESRMMSK